MIRTTAIVAVAVMATLAQADAAWRHHHHRHAGHYYASPLPPYPGYAYGGYYARRWTPGPAWAGPNECWTDEGYGRYAPCSGRSTR